MKLNPKGTSVDLNTRIRNIRASKLDTQHVISDNPRAFRDNLLSIVRIVESEGEQVGSNITNDEVFFNGPGCFKLFFYAYDIHFFLRNDSAYQAFFMVLRA